MNNGISLITNERMKQLRMGYDTARDIQLNGDGESKLVCAAEAYLWPTASQSPNVRAGYFDVPPFMFPWSKADWAPGTLLDNLIKAGALIAAAIDVELAIRDGNMNRYESLGNEPTTEPVPQWQFVPAVGINNDRVAGQFVPAVGVVPEPVAVQGIAAGAIAVGTIAADRYGWYGPQVAGGQAIAGEVADLAVGQARLAAAMVNNQVNRAQVRMRPVPGEYVVENGFIRNRQVPWPEVDPEPPEAP
jgi:hypothetical protein